MSSYDSVVAFTKRAAGLDHLDAVVLNAGVCRDPFTLSKYDWEEDLQVNVLSTTLLGILLLPKLKESNHGSTISILEFVNSGPHTTADTKSGVCEIPSILAEYNKPGRFSAQKQYVHSKLLLMFAANKLAQTTSSSQAIITSVCPGAVSSHLGRDVKIPGISIALTMMRMTVLQMPEQAANAYVTGTA